MIDPKLPAGHTLTWAPHKPLDPILIWAYRAVQPPQHRDHVEWSIEAADMDVDDTIGGE